MAWAISYLAFGLGGNMDFFLLVILYISNVFPFVSKHVTSYQQKTYIGELPSLINSLLKTSAYATYTPPYCVHDSSKYWYF